MIRKREENVRKYLSKDSIKILATYKQFYFLKVTELRLVAKGVRLFLSVDADDAIVPFLLSAVVLFWHRNSTNNRALKSHRRACYAS